MAATKVSATLLASTVVAAGSNASSSTVNLTGAYGVTVYASIINGTTATTAGCTIYVYTSPDGSNWYQFASGVSLLTANYATTFVFEPPPSVEYVSIGFGGHSGASVTVMAQVSYITGL